MLDIAPAYSGNVAFTYKWLYGNKGIIHNEPLNMLNTYPPTEVPNYSHTSAIMVMQQQQYLEFGWPEHLILYYLGIYIFQGK